MATNTLKPFSGELDPPSSSGGLKEFTGTLDGEPSTDGPLSRGWNKSKQNIGITASLAAGNAEQAAAQVAQADTYARANPGMAEGRELGEAWQRGEGISGGIKEVAGEFAKDWSEAPGLIGGLRATGKNLQAMGAGLLEQVPNMVAPVAGMVAGAAGGAAAGSAIPGVGNVAGGLAGGWAGASLGNTAIEGGGMVQAALQKAGIDPQDTQAVQQYLRQNGDTLLGQAGVKGSIIGAVDTLTAGMGGRILNAPARAAVDRALSTMGVDLADKAAVGAAMKTPEFAGHISRDAAYKAAKTGGANLARNAGVAALDPAGEFAGEFVGQGVATGEWDTKDAALEAFSSLGQSGAMFAGQKAYQATKRPLQGKGATADQPAAAEWTTAPGAADPSVAGTELPAASAAPSFEADFGTEPGAASQREGGVEFTRDVDTTGLSLEDPAETERARAAGIDFETADTTPAWQTEPGATAQRAPGLDMPAAEFDTSGLALEGERKPSELLGLDPQAGPLSRTAARAVDARAAQEAQFIGSTGRELAARNLPSTFDTDNVIDVQGRVVDDKAIGMTRRLAGPRDGDGRAGNADVTGQRIDQEWTAFSPTSGTLGVPRAAMPQISSEHRGALLEYLGANGVGAQAGVVPSSSLKPTQAEFSEEKVKRAQQFPSGDRAILISADGYVVDGHHQWLAGRGANAPVHVLQLQAPIQNLLPLVSQFPRARAASGAAVLTQETETYVPQADQAQPDGTQSQASTGAAVAPGAAAAGQAAAAPVTAGAARRARSGGDAARSRAWDANPMRAFLGKHGVSLDSRSEFAPGLKEQRGALVPGYGPVFRKTGKPLDRLVDNAVEEGFLPQGATEADLYGLIDRALRQGDRVAPMYTADAAESQMQAMLERERQLDREQQEAWDQEAADYEAVLAQELATMDDAEYAALDAVIPALNAGSNTSTEAAMRALGFTEQEIQDVVAQQSREPQEGGQRPGQASGTVSGSTQARDGTGQRNARDQEQELSSYTREDVLGRQAAQERTQAEQAQANREADRRAQADRELPEFTLTGSDRPADANPNQGDIFSQPAQEAEPAAKAAAIASKQKRKSYSDKVGDDSRTSTLKGSLVAREQQKRESFERLKKVRQAVKDGRANRLDLLKAEDSHRALVREVAALKAGIPQFSRTEQPAATNAQAAQLRRAMAQRTVDGLARGWSQRPDIVVVNSMQDAAVPEAVRRADEAQRSQGAAGNVEGFWHGGKVYLVADALPSSGDVVRVLYHEVLGHHGLRGHFGPALDKVRDQVAKMRPKDVQAKADEYGLDLSQPAHVRYAAEEVLAEMAQTRPDLALVQRAIAAIRTFLREHVPGFKNLELTDSEIVRNYLLPARGFIERGSVGESEQGARALAVFSRSDDGPEAFVPAPGGGVNYGEISVDVGRAMRRQAAPIRLRQGDDTTGLRHIERTERLAQIRAAGYETAAEFVDDVAKHFDAVHQGRGSSLFLVKKMNRPNRTLVVQLATGESGDFYDVKTAMITRPDFMAGKSVLWERAQSNQSVTGAPSAISGQSTEASLAQSPEGQQAAASQQQSDTPMGALIKGSGDAPQFSRSQPKTAIATSMGTLTPEQERAYLAVAGFDKVPTLRERTKTFTANLGLRMKQAMVDQFAPIAQVDQGAYMLARMSKGSDGTLEAALLYGKPVLRDGVPDVDVKEGGFAQVLASLKGEQDRFLMWVAAQRAESLKAQGKENLFDDRDISSLKTLDAGSMADGTGRARVYAKALQDLNAFNDSVLKMAQESGLIDQAAYDLMQGQPYVPFYRLMEEEGGLQGPSFSKGLTNQKAWKKLKGGSQQLNGDLLQNLLLNWGNLYAASARNRAALATMDAAEKMAVAYKVPADTKGAAKVMRDGMTEHWAVEDPYLLEAISALSYSASPLMKPLAKAKQVLTWGVTVNPTFKLRNLVRDAVSSISMADLSYNPAANVSKGWKLTAKDSQVYASMLASGGVIKFGTQENTERLRAQVAKLGGVVLDQNGAQKLWGQVKAVYDVYQEFGDRTENVNRTALYDRLIAKGHSHAEASFMARDLMDFSMSGSHPVVRFLTQSVPFLNARLQGLYKLGRAAKADPRRFATVAGAVTLASLGLMAAYADDEDWKKREDWDRDAYWWFKIGETAYRIPKPFEVGAIGTLAERTAELVLSEEMTSKRFADRISHMVAQTFAFDPVPQAFKPLLDIYSNKDSFTGRAIESQADQRLRPEDRYNERTSEAARLLGSWGLPDPAQLLKGEWVGLSPKQVDHLLRGYFSWAASAVTTATDYAIRPALDRGDRPAMRLKDVFLAGNFVESLPSGSSRYVSAMYDQARDVEQAYASYRDALARGDKTAAADIMESDGDKLRSRIAMNTATKLLSQLNQQAKKIEASTTMDSTEKRERLQRIEQRRHEIARRAIGVGAT